MVNTAILIGRVGKDPVSRSVGETSQASFSLATSEKYKGKEQTQWHTVIAWGKLSEIVTQYVHKGDMVYVEGKIQYRSWEKDGVTKYVTEIVAQNLRMLSGQGKAQAPKEEEEDFI